jgi:hypothetical protein
LSANSPDAEQPLSQDLEAAEGSLGRVDGFDQDEGECERHE